jgi:hypothetical protein
VLKGYKGSKELKVLRVQAKVLKVLQEELVLKGI